VNHLFWAAALLVLLVMLWMLAKPLLKGDF
jgi:hypothetical protein